MSGILIYSTEVKKAVRKQSWEWRVASIEKAGPVSVIGVFRE